jgi:hypothetical protein
MIKCFSILFSLAFCGFSQTFISGEIKGAFPRDNYIITGNLSVKFGDTLIFEAGSELRFKPNTGLIIRGVFMAAGKVDNSIIFTSAQEDVQSVESNSNTANWWKGINLSAPKVMSSLAYCLFCFCDTAIAIKNTFQKITLDHVVFHKNKSANLVWAGKTIETNDDVQYIYRVDLKDNVQKKDIFPIQIAEDIAYGLKSHWKTLAKPTFAAVSLAGGAMWIFGYMKNKDFDDQYLAVNGQGNQQKMNQLKNKRDQMANLGYAGSAICMIGAGAFLITILF